MKNTILALALLFGFAAFSQQIDNVFKSEETGKIEGSQYFSEDFITATMDGYESTYKIRYNPYLDYIEVKNADGSVSKFNSFDKMRVVSADKQQVYTYLFFDGTMGFLTELYRNPKLAVYQRNRKYLQPESAPSNGYSNYRAAAYKKSETKYYIRRNDGGLVEMPTDKKDFSKLFSGKEADVLAYIKTNKLSLSKTEDLKKVAEYVATLL